MSEKKKTLSFNEIRVNEQMTTLKTIKKENNKDSFFIYICVEGSATITYNEHSENIKKGETILVPASIKHYEINSKKATLLEVYV